MSRLVNALHLSMLMLLLASCGDMFSKTEDEVQVPQYGTCAFDSEALSKILSENIKGDIECLESNLMLFMDVVKSDKKGYLSQKELARYIRAKIEIDTEETIQVLTAVFEINSLLFGDSKSHIAKRNIPKLTELLVELNENMVEGEVYKYFSIDEAVSFNEHNRRKAQIYSALFKTGKAFEKVIKENGRTLDIDLFLNRFENIGNNEVLGYIAKLSFVKKAVLGGSSSVLTSKELKHLSGIFGDVGKIAYDFTNASFIVDKSKDEDEELLKILKEDVFTAQQNFFYKDDLDEVIFTYDQLEDVVSAFFPSIAPYVKYKDSFLKVKNVLLDSNSENFTAGELNILLNDIIYKNLARGVFFYRSYAEENSFFSALTRRLFDFTGLVTIDPIEESFKGDFNRIVQDYRFVQGSEISAYYNYKFHRNPRGVFEISVLEDIIRRFFIHYGDLDTTANGDYVISLEKLQTLMVDYSQILEGEGFILHGRVASTAETITLMATLFHYQSNGDSRIEIPEFVEFASTVLSSLSLTTHLEDFMQSKCEDAGNGKIHPQCFRDNFTSFLNEKSESKAVRDYIPELGKYLESLSDETREKYIRSAARFSRACTEFTNREEVPMDNGDYIVSLAGLLLIEQSIIKLDTAGKRGTLEINEVYRAYYLYKSAIEGLVPVESLKKYSKEIFLYIVKFNEVPELPEFDPSEITGRWYSRAWQTIAGRWRQVVGAAKAGKKFLGFVYDLKFNNAEKDIYADRMTFAAVLGIIANSSSSNEENPFPCDSLRDKVE